jgi:hypothetical protein
MRWTMAGALTLAGCGGVLGAGKERPDECADRIDNDRDLLWDADDPDCLGVPDAAVPGDGSVSDPAGGSGSGGTTLPTSQCDGPPQITDLSVECDPTGQAVVISVELNATADEAALFMMDTANEPPWSEDHPMERVAGGPCSETWRVELDTTEYGTGSPDAYQAGRSTLYPCPMVEDPSLMTYAAWAKNGAGTDCLATGDDPSGLAAGAYDAEMFNEASFNLGRCEVAR